MMSFISGAAFISWDAKSQTSRRPIVRSGSPAVSVSRTGLQCASSSFAEPRKKMILKSDMEVLENLTLDPTAQPSFEVLKCCLIWPDERPFERLSHAGQEFLSDLWIVRGFIHRSVPRDEWGLDPDYFWETWNFGLSNVARWPGFQRLTISDADRACLEFGMTHSPRSL